MKVNEIPSSFLIIHSPEMFYFRLKGFNLIKGRNKDVVKMEKLYFGELSVVVIRGQQPRSAKCKRILKNYV